MSDAINPSAGGEVSNEAARRYHERACAVGDWCKPVRRAHEQTVRTAMMPTEAPGPAETPLQT